MARRRRIRPASAVDSLSPWKILGQIASLQGIYYLAATVLILFTTLVAGTPFSLDLIFSWRSLRGDNTIGWTLGLVWMLDSLLSVIAITWLVGRTKFVLDFSLTLHFLHLLTTSFYTRALPMNWLWWALQLASSVMMISLATWTCQWREMRPIAWKGGRTTGGGGGGGGDGSTSTRHAGEAASDIELARLKQDDRV